MSFSFICSLLPVRHWEQFFWVPVSILLTLCEKGKEESQIKEYIVKSMLICCFDL